MLVEISEKVVFTQLYTMPNEEHFVRSYILRRSEKRGFGKNEFHVDRFVRRNIPYSFLEH